MALFLQLRDSFLLFHLIWCFLVVVASPTSTYFAHSLTLAFPTPRHRQLQKGVDKARNKFVEWKANHPQNSILLVDGNNLRGIGKFEWNFVELKDRIACFCHDWNITKVIVVWDHGRCPSAYHKTYQSHDDNAFSLDMILLFSGTSQRADDVLIAESKQLVALFSKENEDPSRHEKISLDWSSLAFVTQDRELTYKLRRHAMECMEQQHNIDSQSGDVSIDFTSPLISDSTRFLELLRNTTDVSWNKDCNEEMSLTALQQSKDSLVQFYKEQRRRYNPRREKTWERVVAAEVYRSALARQDLLVPRSDSLIQIYLSDLETRGLSSTCNNEEERKDRRENSLPFVGPTRLDKKQRRFLQRYNNFAKHNK